jgi:hypothetical protein
MRTAEEAMGRVFGLDSSGWARHANPWSVYTRIPAPVLLAAAVWTREWIGWWSLAPVALVCLWIGVNPRAFPPPADLRAWASRSVLGENFWSARSTTPVPERHRVAPLVLSALSAAGLPFIVWGLIAAEPWILATGLVTQTTGKLWFLDRMVWLHDDMTALGHTPPAVADRKPARS